MGTDSEGRQFVRYTIRIELPLEDRSVKYRAVTSLGEPRAAVMAAFRAGR
jgi:hypothetical protein